MMSLDESEVSDELRAPFPWFGGKRRCAEAVWDRLGNVATYNEPFAGSLAVLLARPHAPRVETVNDLDCYLANFWRALQHDPEGVAYYADGPVNEADLHARHRWLVDHRPEAMMSDPEFYDVRTAGWWVWGQCLWIGSGWCSLTDKRNQHPSEQRKKFRAGDVGTHRKRPSASRTGESVGVHRKRFVNPGNGQGAGVHSLGAQGINGGHRRWQGGGEAGGGSGVHAVGLTDRKRPHISNRHGDGGGMGVHRVAVSARTDGLYAYLQQLAARLRRVRVCCGDWTRVLTPSVTTYVGICGVFLDPPYAHDLRERCYSEDHDISAEVREWALAHGDNPDFRIALCGYEGEHEMPSSWECVPWKAHGGYSRTERGVANRSRERIWFSPHCLQAGLFAGGAAEDGR